MLSEEETKTPSYEQDDYPEINTDSSKFDGIRDMWGGEFSPSITEKMEDEGVYFTGSDWPGNIHGFNPNPGRVVPAAAREMLRRPTSNAPDHKSRESLGVLVRRISELLKSEDNFGVRSGNRTYVDLVIDTFIKLGIDSNHDVNVALFDTRNTLNLIKTSMKDSRKQVEVLSSLTRKALTTEVHPCIWTGDGATTTSTFSG